MEKLKMALLGAGNIAGTMAQTVSELKEAEVVAVASRNLEKAEAFAERFGIARAYGSYEEMLADPEVQLVYIATPHSHHFKHAKMSLEAGKHVLCEKSFTVNADQARELCALAKERKLLITEAIWTRYMPARAVINEIIERGMIGEVTSLMANLNYDVMKAERIVKPELAGGALLDLTVYPINFARMVFGDTMTDCTGTAVFRGGVDIIDSVTMTFEGGKMAVLHSNATAMSERNGMIYGKNGHIHVENINNPEAVTVYDKEYREIFKRTFQPEERGYRFEVLSCVKAIEEGRLECPEMPHEETVKVMEIMDGLRKSWGYEIPLIR